MSKDKFLHLDRAAFYAIAFKALGILTGPITVLLIASRFTPELQGYYYTFTAVLTMQALLELGLGLALQQVTSHEWAHLGFDDQGGVAGQKAALDRLAALTRFALRWFAVTGVLAVFGFSLGGYLFFQATAGQEAIAWQTPWFLLSVLTGLNFFLSPGWAILEGCNEVRKVYGFRFLQGLLTRVALWTVMLLGGGLWALVLERGVLLLLTAIFFVYRYRRFFLDLLKHKARLNGLWRREIWPLQWRFALVWVSGFLPTLFIPAIFALQGSVAAGKIGMTWAIVSALFAVSHIVIKVRTPGFAIAAAQQAYDRLDRLFHAALRTSFSLLIGGSLLFLAALFLLETWKLKMADRFLPLLPTILLLGAIFFQQIRQAMAAYLRAHKKEPYLVLSIVEAVVTLGLLYPLGKTYGATGIAAGFCLVAGATFLPGLAIFRRCRRLWH